MTALPQTVSELIADNLSLERIKDIKENLLKQKSTIEYQLTKESATQFSHVQKSLDMLNISQKSVNSIKESINEVNKLSEENKTSISRYDVIFNATELYETIHNTSLIYDKIVQFGSVCDKVEQMIEYELNQDALETGCPSLLEIHYLLTKIRDFEDQMTIMANVATDDVQRTARRLFTRVSSLVTKFDQLLETLVYDIVEIARSEQASLDIRLFKIIDLEEREDLKINAIRNVIKKKEIELERMSIKKLPNSTSRPNIDATENPEDNYPTARGLYQEIINGTISTRTLPRGYKNFFSNKLKQSIQDMFVEVRKTYTGENKFDVLNNLDWVFNELMVVKELLVKYTPQHWNLFHHFYELYYHELNVLINELVEYEPETLIILDILDYDKTFQANLIADFGYAKKDVKSIIGDEQKETLFKDYLSLLVTKMTEWINNLEKAEFAVFEERSTPPHIDSDGLFFLDGTKTCFQMFTQQVEVASGANQAAILSGVVEKFIGLLLERQKDWAVKINEETEKVLKYNELYDIDPHDIPEDAQVPGGLIEYIVAISNDQMKAADYSIAISRKCEDLLKKSWMKEITKHFDSALDSFASLVRVGCLGLTRIIFDDLKVPYTEIFSKQWYDGNQIKQISYTIDEYIGEIKPRMSPIVFTSFIGFIIDECFLQYLSALNEKHQFKFKNNKFVDAVRRDFELFFKLFTKYVAEDQKTEIIDRRFKIIEYFMNLSCEPVDTIMDIWRDVITEYPETSVDFLEAVLNCRKDVDNSTRKKYVQLGLEYSESPEVRTNLKELTASGTELSFISRFQPAPK